MPIKKNKKYFDFLKNVKETIRQYDMISKGDRVLAAVSGGADSVCMLNVLLEIAPQMDIEIIAANMDHGLRGDESKRDSDFVRELAFRKDLKCEYKRVNIKDMNNSKLSTEELARKERYTFLEEAAEANRCNVISTGHTMDDQAETVIMRMIYGSSPAGLTGIPPVREKDNIKVVRPLIRSDRASIIEYIDAVGADFVEDSSNYDTRFRRNNIRKEILPYLEKLNPRIRRTLVNLSDTLREDMELVEYEKEKLLAGYSCSRDGIKIKDIIMQPVSLRKEIFKELFISAGGNVKKLTYRHWTDMDIFLRSATKGMSLDLPGDIRVTRMRDKIVFAKRNLE